MNHEIVNFRELYQKQSWLQRAIVLERRASLFRVLDTIDQLCEEISRRRKHKKGVSLILLDLKHWMFQLEDLENELQKAWDLKATTKWHTYWMLPKACTCPKLDNTERLGHGRIISEDCPLHGKYFGRGL